MVGVGPLEGRVEYGLYQNITWMSEILKQNIFLKIGGKGGKQKVMFELKV